MGILLDPRSGPKANADQIRFIEILAGDLTFNREARNAHVSDIAGRTIKYLDELSMAEAIKVIDQFRTWKYKL